MTVLRCENTGNPCGTDTYQDGYHCQCVNCAMDRLLSEQTATQVMRDQKRANALLIAAGRAMAPQVNRMLDRLAKDIAEKAELKPVK